MYRPWRTFIIFSVIAKSKNTFSNELYFLPIATVFENILGLFFSSILKSFEFKYALVSLPIISFFLVSIYICENSYELSILSTILIEPTDLNIFVCVRYSKLSNKILLFSVSVIIVLDFEEIDFFLCLLINPLYSQCIDLM